jgi:predicted ATPase
MNAKHTTEYEREALRLGAFAPGKSRSDYIKGRNAVETMRREISTFEHMDNCRAWYSYAIPSGKALHAILHKRKEKA